MANLPVPGDQPVPVRDFVSFMFAGWGGKWQQVQLASFPGSPRDKRTAMWGGFRAHRLRGELRDDHNNYWCIALLDAKRLGRGDRLVTASPVLALDDIGTKVPLPAFRAAVGSYAPHAVVETSPGNFSAFYRLAPGSTLDEAAQLRAVTAQLGLSDPATLDASRYMRVPSGINGKQLGAPFPVRLRRLSTAPSYPAGVLLEHFARAATAGGLTPPTASTPLTGGVFDIRGATFDDPWVALAQAIGLSPQQVRPGVIEADCPFAFEHTGGDPTGFAFINADGRCKCHHGHCQYRRTPEFKARISELYAEQFPGDTAGAFTVRWMLARDPMQQLLLDVYGDNGNADL